MKYKILLCCAKDWRDYVKIFRAVLSTDKQRTHEEFCNLLLACYDRQPHYVTLLLQKYKNLPLQDVFRVLNHLLTDKKRPRVVYRIIDVYSEYHDIFRAMRNEIQSKPDFGSVVAEVVKKYTDIFAHNSSQDSVNSDSSME